MHVLVLPSWYPESSADISGSFFREQALALHQAGVQTGVLAVFLRSVRKATPFKHLLTRSTVELDQGVTTIRRIGVNVYFGNVERRCQWHVRSAMPLFESYVDQHGKPDVIHVHSLLFAAAVAREIKRKFDIPFVVTEHSSAFLRGRLSEQKLSLAAALAGEAGRRIAVSNEFARKLEEVLSPKLVDDAGAGWSVVPNIVDGRFFSVGQTGRNGTEFKFVTLGSLEPNKRVDLVIRAFAARFANTPKVRLKVIGDGPQRGDLESLAGRLGVSQRVEFVGRMPRDEVANTLGSCHCMVMASQYETFGVAAAEALACGVPVIGTRCGGLEDVLDEGDGELVDVDDENALGDAMERLLLKQDQVDRQGIRNRCQCRFGATAVVTRLWDIYRETLAGQLAESRGD